jgi:hypothetical protein
MNSILTTPAVRQEPGPGTPAVPTPSPKPETSADGTGGATPHGVNPDPAVRAWIEDINRVGQGRVEWIIRAGGRFTAAKAELDHGQWGQLFGPAGVHFSQRQAEMLMAIARHPALANPQNCSKVPCHWSILYALSRIPVEALAQAIASGRVCPGTTLRDAQEMAKRYRVGAAGAAVDRANKKFDPDKRLNQLVLYLAREVGRWPAAH